VYVKHPQGMKFFYIVPVLERPFLRLGGNHIYYESKSVSKKA
jgi:hypothetical protein